MPEKGMNELDMTHSLGDAKTFKLRELIDIEEMIVTLLSQLALFYQEI